MKDGIHPKYNPVLFIDSSTNKEFIINSTATSKETRNVDGVDMPVIHLEVTSDTHPFWTGKMHHVDSAGRIERFKNRFENNYASGKRKTRKAVKKAESED